MSHTQTLIMNRTREALEKLQKEGIGFINYENTGVIGYKIDEKEYEIIVKTVKEPAL